MFCFHCHQSNRPNAHFCSNCRAPLLLQNKYRVSAQLGRGGFGAVYYAQQNHLGDVPCAIKELIPDPNANPQQLQQAATQFQLEASILARLSNSALPRVTDFFNEGDRYYLVMEYVEGETLEERLHQAGMPLPERVVLAWAEVLCDTLSYLHSQNPPVIHRDLKPSNIKLTPEGRVKLLDFGIAKLLAGNTYTAARAVTPPYAPLEQYGKRTDARTDIYALGVTLYQLLTNQLPPEAPDRAGEPVIPLRQINRALSAGTEAAILKAMAMDPANRFQDAQEFKRALQLSASPPKSSPQGIYTVPAMASPQLKQVGATPLSTPARNNSSRWISGIVFGFFAIGGIALLASYLFDSTPTPPSATPPTTIAVGNTPTLLQPTVVAAKTENPVVSPTNSQTQFDSLYDAAKQEGTLSVIALPHDWCNYGTMIDKFKRKYPGITINELNPDAGSGDEIEAIRTNLNNKGPSNPDVIDVSLAFALLGKTEGLLQPYKVTSWETIPDDLKDTDGYWYGDYFGVMSFMVNTDVVKNVPQDWNDLLKPEYKNQVALSGDPRISNQGISTVHAAALANGGSLDDARPGLAYFSDLASRGNLNKLIANNASLARGITPIRLTYSFNALAGRDLMQNAPTVEVVVPRTGRYGSGFAMAINAYAPHANAAKLWMEYVYSDEGQLTFLEAPGYCYPVRFSNMLGRGIIPTSLLNQLTNIEGVVFPNTNQVTNARDIVTKQWDSIVGADIKNPP